MTFLQEAATGQWFKFSDAFVEKLQSGRNGKLGSEADPLQVNGTSASNGQSNGQSNGCTNKKMVNGSVRNIKVIKR